MFYFKGDNINISRSRRTTVTLSVNTFESTKLMKSASEKSNVDEKLVLKEKPKYCHYEIQDKLDKILLPLESTQTKRNKICHSQSSKAE